MCCTWFAHDCTWATWVYVLETVCGTVRRLSKNLELRLWMRLLLLLLLILLLLLLQTPGCSVSNLIPPAPVAVPSLLRWFLMHALHQMNYTDPDIYILNKQMPVTGKHPASTQPEHRMGLPVISYMTIYKKISPIQWSQEFSLGNEEKVDTHNCACQNIFHPLEIYYAHYSLQSKLVPRRKYSSWAR